MSEIVERVAVALVAAGVKKHYCSDLHLRHLARAAIAAGAGPTEALESQVALWRDCFEEITAKAVPYGRDDPIRCYIIPAGPLHRTASKTGCQAFNLDANLRAVLAEHQRVMIEEVIPAIEADERERALAAIELRFPRLHALDKGDAAMIDAALTEPVSADSTRQSGADSASPEPQ